MKCDDERAELVLALIQSTDIVHAVLNTAESLATDLGHGKWRRPFDLDITRGYLARCREDRDRKMQLLARVLPMKSDDERAELVPALIHAIDMLHLVLNTAERLATDLEDGKWRRPFDLDITRSNLARCREEHGRKMQLLARLLRERAAEKTPPRDWLKRWRRRRNG